MSLSSCKDTQEKYLSFRLEVLKRCDSYMRVLLHTIERSLAKLNIKDRMCCKPINCSQFHGFWQSFVTIGSCNHLMRIISTYVGNTKKSEISMIIIQLFKQLFKLGIINYGVYKGLYHISCLLQIIKPFIRPHQGLLFLVVKIL